MVTSSVLPGTAPLLQLAASVQYPPDVLIQLLTVGITRSSRSSMPGRNGRRGPLRIGQEYRLLLMRANSFHHAILIIDRSSLAQVFPASSFAGLLTDCSH